MQAPHEISRGNLGHFLPGQSANPSGKPIGTQDKAKPWKNGELTIEDLNALESLTKSQIIAIAKRVGGAVWGIALKTEEEIFEAQLLKLATLSLTDDNITRCLPAMKEWMDRRKGKAAQSVTMTVKDEGLGKLSDARLLRLEAELARVTGEEQLVIAPMPKKLSDQSKEED